MSTVHEIDNEILMLTKGALDSILPKTTHILVHNEVREITKSDIENIENINTMFAETSLRVLTLLIKYWIRKRNH